MIEAVHSVTQLFPSVYIFTYKYYIIFSNTFFVDSFFLKLKQSFSNNEYVVINLNDDKIVKL